MLGNILIGLLIVVTASLVFNHYVFSWVGLVLSRVGLCKYKSLQVPARNGADKRLSFSVEFAAVVAALSSNPIYRVSHDDYKLSVRRIYGDLEYTIQFTNWREEGELVSYFGLSTYTTRKSTTRWRKCSDDPAGYYTIIDEDIPINEKCSAPVYRIKRNVYRMIRDLPLGYWQRAELKANVRVRPVVLIGLF